MQANLRRRTRASSDSAISDMAAASALSNHSYARARNVSDAVQVAGGGGGGGDGARPLSPVAHPRRRGLSTPSQSPSLASDVTSCSLSPSRGKRSMTTRDHRSPSQVPSEGWSDWGLGESWDELRDPGTTAKPLDGVAGNVGVNPSSPPPVGERRRTIFSPTIPAWARDRLRAASSPTLVSPEEERGTDESRVPSAGGGGGMAGAVGRNALSSLRYDVWGGGGAGRRDIAGTPLSIGAKDVRLSSTVLGPQELHETE